MSDHQADHGYGTVNVYRAPGAVKIELNRPERLNAWSSELSADLLRVLREVAADEAVRAVMLTGSGRSFCSGADLKEGMAAARANDGRIDTESTLVTWYHPIVTAIREMPKPVVAAVNGPAAGAGLSLALAADLVVAAARPSLRSAPAQNARPAPVSMTARTSSSAATSRSTVSRSDESSLDQAFSRSGRFSSIFTAPGAR